MFGNHYFGAHFFGHRFFGPKSIRPGGVRRQWILERNGKRFYFGDIRALKTFQGKNDRIKPSPVTVGIAKRLNISLKGRYSDYSGIEQVEREIEDALALERNQKDVKADHAEFKEFMTFLDMQ